MVFLFLETKGVHGSHTLALAAAAGLVLIRSHRYGV